MTTTITTITTTIIMAIMKLAMSDHFGDNWELCSITREKVIIERNWKLASWESQWSRACQARSNMEDIFMLYLQGWSATWSTQRNLKTMPQDSETVSMAVCTSEFEWRCPTEEGSSWWAGLKDLHWLLQRGFPGIDQEPIFLKKHPEYVKGSDLWERPLFKQKHPGCLKAVKVMQLPEKNKEVLTCSPLRYRKIALQPSHSGSNFTPHLYLISSPVPQVLEHPSLPTDSWVFLAWFSFGSRWTRSVGLCTKNRIKCISRKLTGWSGKERGTKILTISGYWQSQSNWR